MRALFASLLLPLLVLLVLVSAPAPARADLQAQLLDASEALWLAGAREPSEAEEWALVERLVDWAFFDGEWRPPQTDAGQYGQLRALLDCRRCAEFPPARDALLLLAEGHRQAPRAVMDLVFASAMAARCGPRQPQDPFAPTQADEALALALMLAEVEETVARRHAHDAAVLAALRAGAGARLLTRLDALEGPGWEAQVEALLTSDDPARIESHLLGGQTLRTLRRTRARYLGLSTDE